MKSLHWFEVHTKDKVDVFRLKHIP
jgi:hypothetical protein